MKKTKILTVLGVLLAMGITACGGNTNNGGKEGSKSTTPSSTVPSGGSSGGGGGSSVPPSPKKDATGHIWGEGSEVKGDAEAGTADYLKALCTEDDNAVKVTVNQSQVVYATGSSRKDGTPEGYTKLSKDGQSMSFKFNYDKYAKGKLYFFGRMDGWSTAGNQSAGFYKNGNPSIEVKVNNKVLDISAQKDKTYKDYFGEHDNETGLSSPSDHLSDEGYAPVAEFILNKGVNEVSYKRVQTQNMIIKDFVFVIEQEFESEWTEPQTVAGETGYVGYKKSTNNLTGEVKLEIKALDGTFAEGSSNKSGTEEGYLKLNTTNNNISWKFKYDSAAIGSLSQLGFMDSYSSNHDVLYSWTSTSGTHNPTEEGNLRVEINGNKIDKSAYMDIRCEDLTKDGDATVFAESKNYSPLTVLPLGNLVLKNGDNELKFTRLGSYNYPTSTLILIVKNAAAEYTVETALSSNNDIHYNAVTGTDVIFNRENHKWASDTDLASTDTESTCTVQGIVHEKCSVCQKTRERKLDLLPHTWVSDPDLAATDTESTCSAHGVVHVKCSECGAKDTQELPFGAHAWVDGTPANNSDGFAVTPFECSACHKVGAKMAVDSFTGNTKTGSTYKHDNNTTVTYKMIAPKAGNYQLKIGAFVANNRGKDLSVAPYTVKLGVGDAAVDVPVSSGTYEELGIGTSSAAQFVLCPTITLAAGENVISLSQGSGGFRLTFGGLVEIYEI